MFMAAVARIAAAISKDGRFDRRLCWRNTPLQRNGFIVTEPAYSVYLVRCRDGTVYTGIATDVERRLREHESSARGAKYLRGKGPLTLLYQRQVGDRSIASRIEHEIKQLPKQDKSDQAALSARIDAVLSDFDAVNRE